MSFGLDYVTAPPIAEMKKAGVSFVCRYLSEVNPATKVKLLTLGEAKGLGQAGIAIVSNYEWTGDTALGGSPAGVFDAQIAAEQHAACGGPANRPIYFSVDFGATAAQMPAIIEYFKGVSSVIGLHRTGAYGSYFVIRGLLDAGVIAWGWQTYAWSGGAWEPRAHIRQYNNGVTFAGQSVDYDRSMQADFGQWIYGGHMPIPDKWADKNNILTAPNGVPVERGFRQYIIDAATSDAGNVPCEAEYAAPQVLLHNAKVGAGTRQLFRDSLLWYTTAQGVVDEPYTGLELDAAYKLIAAQQAEIATLQVTKPTPVPPGATVDTSTIEADTNAIIDALPPLFARLLADIKKLKP